MQPASQPMSRLSFSPLSLSPQRCRGAASPRPFRAPPGRASSPQSRRRCRPRQCARRRRADPASHPCFFLFFVRFGCLMFPKDGDENARGSRLNGVKAAAVVAAIDKTCFFLEGVSNASTHISCLHARVVWHICEQRMLKHQTHSRTRREGRVNSWCSSQRSSFPESTSRDQREPARGANATKRKKKNHTHT